MDVGNKIDGQIHSA